MSKTEILSDIYNAKLFAELNKHQIVWCKNYGGWIIYNGQYWKKDDNDQIKSFAMEWHIELAKRMIELGGGYALAHAKRSANNAALNSMLDCAKSFLAFDMEEFDRNPLLINCNNYTLDLSGDSVYKQKPDDYITKKANVEYSLLANCPLWEKFIDEIFIGDIETIEYIQRVIGYGMTALTREQAMFILYGHGRNGKSKFLETISDILGDYATNCPSSTFVLKQNPGIPNDVARLKGARFVSASETNHNVNMDEELIKQLTGNKVITARFLNKEYFDFNSTFKIFLATNHKPNIRGTDTGIWRRIQMIPFDYKVTEASEDRELGDKLASESSGIFNWMIEGYKKYNKIGLAIPDRIRHATQLYREEEDDIGQFIKESCIIERGAFISVNDFKEAFKQSTGYYKSGKMMAEYMNRLGHRDQENTRRSVNGKQVRGYNNIRLATDIDRIGGEPVIWKDGEYGKI